MIPVKYLAVLSVAVVVLASLVVSIPSVHVSTEEDGDPSEDDDYPVYDPIINDLPDGFTYTESTHTVHSDDVVEWTIFDNYHTFMDSRYDEYEGYSVISDSISLDVGSYTITVGMCSSMFTSMVPFPGSFPGNTPSKVPHIRYP